MANDYPQIVDQSTLTGVFQADQFLGIGIEGEMDGGTATIGLPELVRSAEEADTLFGAGSSLANLVKFLLGRGLNEVWAVASADGTAPLLADRQAAWAPLEENPDVRIRLTDSSTQADLVALADSCENAETIQHKQFCIVAIASGVKATVLAAAAAVASKRAVVVAPGFTDLDGVTQSGATVAALVAGEIAKNPDIGDSLNNVSIGATTGIEIDATTGLPLYRLRANGGVPINDFQDLLTGGVSPLQLGRDGLAAFTHLRTSFTTDDTFDALMTLLITDQVFIDIRDLLLSQSFLREGNTATNRSLAAKVVDRYLAAHADLVEPVQLPDGTVGYGVSATPSSDLKSFTIAYHGQVVRGTNVININGTLTIPV